MNTTKPKLMEDKKVRTPVFKASFPHLFEKHQFEDSKPAYMITALFDEEINMKPFKKAMEAAAIEKWGNVPKGLHYHNFKDGDEFLDDDDEPREDYEGTKVSRFQSKNKRPTVYDAERDEIDDSTEVYGGCYCVAIVNAFAWEWGKKKKGVSLGLLGVQKVKDGERFGGKGSGASEDDFEDHSDDNDSDNSEEKPEKSKKKNAFS